MSEQQQPWWRKYLSRKFLIMLAAEVAAIGIGLGYDIDKELLITVAGGIAGIYVIVEGIIDSIGRS